MSLLRKALYPISVLYGEIIKVRNTFYDKGIFKSESFKTPIIVVGNLTVGGTGKSPQIEYLIRLLKEDFKIATLSRGYKRKTKGFIIASKTSDATQIGDEPFQFHRKFPEITVCVDANRVEAIKKLKQLENPPEIILLDDAYQHRKVVGGFNILLTSFDNLYVDDSMLPTGNLREKIAGADRAQIIVVTKCPDILSESKQFELIKKLKPTIYQTVFFSKIVYSKIVQSLHAEITVEALKNYEIVLVTGIAKPEPLLSFLEDKVAAITHMQYSDHHVFTEMDIKKIKKTFSSITSEKKIILTTEKDFMRISEKIKDIYYLEIQTEFLEYQKDFNTLILKYILQAFKNETEAL